MNKWTARLLSMATLVGSWSKDPSTKCGCVIAKGNRIISVGFNGYPAGVVDDISEPREIKLAKTVHAEVNAILQAKVDLTGCTLYVTPIPPCSKCASIIAQTGISKIVVGLVPGMDLKRWQESVTIAYDIFNQKEIVVMEVEID